MRPGGQLVLVVTMFAQRLSPTQSTQRPFFEHGVSRLSRIAFGGVAQHLTRRMAVLYQAYLDVKFELVAHNLVVEPVGKRRFCVYDFLNLLRKSSAFLIHAQAIDDFVFTVFKIVLISKSHQNIVKRLFPQKSTRSCESSHGQPSFLAGF